MTRQRRLHEVLNVRLDDALAGEIRRIAAASGESESEVARRLMSYGAEVSRRLEADDLSRPYGQTYPEHRKAVIEARWEPVTDEDRENP